LLTVEHCMIRRGLIIFILIFCLNAWTKAQSYVDSLETKLILVDNEMKLEILDELIPYYYRNDPNKAMNKAEKMNSIAQHIGDKRYVVKASRYRGHLTSIINSEHEKALLSCQETEIKARSNGFIEELILTKLAIADIYFETGNYTNALNNQLEADFLVDSMNFVHLKSLVLNAQALSYIELKDLDQAMQSLKSSINNAKLHEQTEIEASTHMIFGELYDKVFDYEMSLIHFKKAHQIYMELKKDIPTANAHFNMGVSYFAMDSLQHSFTHHHRALQIRNRIRDYRGLAESYNEFGHLFIEIGQFQRAINNLKLGLNYSERINSNLLMQTSFGYLSQAHRELQDFENAHFYLDRYAEISELIYTEANAKSIQEIANQQEVSKREDRIKDLEAEYNHKAQQVANRDKFIGTLIILLVVIIISVYFFIKSYREKRIINKHLQEINEQVIKQNEELMQANTTKDKFFSIIGHDLKGPLNSLTSFSSLLINHTASLTEQEIRTIAKDLDKSLKNLYELLENLLGWARSQTGRLEFKPENFQISDVIKESIRLLSKAALNKKIKIELLVEDNITVYADLNSVKTVVRNLLSNAIKFTGEEGVISVFVDEWKDKVEIGIHDTGVGMSEEVMNKIFDISAKHSTLGTNEEKGTGLGLILCKEFVERNHGILSVESEEDVGSTFKFTLPKTKQAPAEAQDVVEVNHS